MLQRLPGLAAFAAAAASSPGRAYTSSGRRGRLSPGGDDGEGAEGEGVSGPLPWADGVFPWRGSAVGVERRGGAEEEHVHSRGPSVGGRARLMPSRSAGLEGIHPPHAGGDADGSDVSRGGPAGAVGGTGATLHTSTTMLTSGASSWFMGAPMGSGGGTGGGGGAGGTGEGFVIGSQTQSQRSVSGMRDFLASELMSNHSGGGGRADGSGGGSGGENQEEGVGYLSGKLLASRLSGLGSVRPSVDSDPRISSRQS